MCAEPIVEQYPPRVTIRRATEQDCERVLAWNNDPRSRAMSVNREAIELEQHQTWYAATLASSDRRLYVGESAEGVPLGLVRFDLDFATAHVRVSINLGPEARGRGFALPLLQQAIAALRAEVALPQGIELVAVVRNENVPSKKCFLRARFKPSGDDGQFTTYIRSASGEECSCT